jgi:hypothetical protein
MMRQHAWWLHTSAVVGTVIVVMAWAAWTALPWWEYAFLSDDSPVSWLSSALLMANAAVALNLSLTRVLAPFIGGPMALALALMALDEQFLLHERFKASVPAVMGNAPAMLMGIGGLGILVVLMNSVRSLAARWLFAIAVVVGLFALGIDVGTSQSSVALFEEGFEVMAEALFLSGLLEASRTQVQSAS